MADDEDKTEEPTSKKIEDAKGEGNVAKSMEVTGATILTFGSVYLLFFSFFTVDSLKEMMLYVYNTIGQPYERSVFYSLMVDVVMLVLKALMPLFGLIFFLALVSNWLQFGFIAVPLKIDFQKLDAIKGMKNLFSFKKAIEAFKLSMKLFIIILVMFVILMLTHKMFLQMMDQDPEQTIKTILRLVLYFLSAILLIIIIFAIMDFYFTRYYYNKSLRMSKQEIKDEYKNLEGDPQVKGRIKKLQMEMAQKRMMNSVPDADVVITNPTHYAVAMKYDNEKNQAPIIIAKGLNYIALKIKDLAKENNIPIVENPALARALYEQIEIEQEIPSEFYKAVAEIFSYVFELKKRG